MSARRTALAAQQRESLPARAHPTWLAPMLATLTSERFSDPDWVYERKLDGVRCLACATARGCGCSRAAGSP